MPIRILLADDHAMWRETVGQLLYYKGGDAYTVVGEAGDAEVALIQIGRHRPDILLLDYKMPGMGRLSAFCKTVHDRCPPTRILVLSGYSQEEIAREAALGGADGYILKGASFEDLLKAIKTIHTGGVWVDPRLPPQTFRAFLAHYGKRAEKLQTLSRQELTVLFHAADGMTNREISLCLHISEKTVKNHLTSIFAKLEVTSRGEATSYFLAGSADQEGT